MSASSVPVNSAVIPGLNRWFEPFVLTQSLELTAQFLGLAALAGALAAVTATASRQQYNHTVPREFILLLGVSAVTGYLIAAGSSGPVIPETAVDGDIALALFALGAFLSGAAGSLLGRHVGTRFAIDILGEEQQTPADSEPRRPDNREEAETERQEEHTVSLPETIADSVGYEPAGDSVKADLTGATFNCPPLSPAELETWLATRIRAEYDLAHVDISVSADGTVSSVTVGDRSGGIGNTLPAETTAVAIRADPAPTASPGDEVQVWETDPFRQVLTGEIRGIAGDIVTLAIAASDTPRIDPRREYRLVTLPATNRAPQEFAERLAEADETVATATVAAGSPLHGFPVGALSLTVVALTREDGTVVSLPETKTRLTPGTELVAIGEPSALRTVQQACEPLDPSLVSAGDKQESIPQTTASQTEADVQIEPETRAQPATDGTTEPAAARSPDKSHSHDMVTAESSQSMAEPEPAAAAEANSAVAGKAGSERFAELKAQFEAEESEDSADDSEKSTDEQPPDEGEMSVDETQDDTGGSTFAQLKEEFESGDADWAAEASLTDESPDETEDDSLETTEQSTAAEETASEQESGVVPLEEAEISFGDDSAGSDSDESTEEKTQADEELSFDDDDDLSALSMDDDDDDLAALSFDEDDSEGLFDDESDDELVFGEDDETASGEETAETEDQASGSEEDEDDDEDDDGDSGGGSTFAQLKEEFESGDADWADDVSDSPGGDMRLDE